MFAADNRINVLKSELFNKSHSLKFDKSEIALRNSN